MKWYAVVDNATGEAMSFGTQLADPLPAGMSAVEIAHQPDEHDRWDPATRALVARTAIDPVVKHKRLRDLRAKGWTNLTLAEKDEARALAFDLGEPSPPSV